MKPSKMEAMYYENESESVYCRLCPIGCKIKNGQLGFCKIRKNENGTLYAEHYGKVTAIAVDPIEKKPLCRFESGSQILSIGGYGCNFRCPFCQNHSISMGQPNEESLSPQEAAKIAKSLVPRGNKGIAYTYNEPFINYEYMYDTATLVHEAGLKNIIVTNGFINMPPLLGILPLIDAMNIDLKGYSSRFYDMVGGKLDTVKQIIAAAAEKCHVEITTLVIPNENDDISEIDEMCRFIAEINPEIPLHLSRFFPNYKMSDKKPTPVNKLKELAQRASKHLNYVYIGNV